jgi:hypothetical protein
MPTKKWHQKLSLGHFRRCVITDCTMAQQLTFQKLADHGSNHVDVSAVSKLVTTT